jgi:hypothetical protein
MTKNTVTVRDLSKAAARTQRIVKLLSRKRGMSAEALRADVGAYTKHNAWSLTRMGAMFGYILETTPGSEFRDGLMRYRFEKPAAKPARSAKR